MKPNDIDQRKIVVAGTGYWGRNLVRVFNDLGVLAAVCDSDQGKLKEYKKRYGLSKTYTDFEDILGDATIEAVVISTPAATHYSLARRALWASKHVFVEKPLSLKVSEGEELVRLAEEENRVLMVGHILQYHPAIVKLKELIDKGELGKIQYIYSNRLNLGKVRTEENILWSFAPHDISVMLMLLNEEPDLVAAQGGNFLKHDVADVTMTTLNFPSGVKGHIFVSWLHPYKEQKLIVVGDRKMAVFDDVSKDRKLQIFPHRIEWIDRMPVALKVAGEAVETGDDEPLRLECIHFIECIKGNRKPRTDGAEGLRVLKVLQACQESMNSSGSPIPLKPANRPYFAHETAVIDEPCTIGEGTNIWHFSHILKNAVIGKNCNIGQNVVISNHVEIGDNVKVQNNVSIYEGVVIEDDVFCGPSAVFTNVINPRSFISRKSEYKRILVQKGATIGANATIVCGNTIGHYSFVGAGAVVTKDVPDYALVLGNPAKIAGWICMCGIRLKPQGDLFICESCGKKYILKEQKLSLLEDRGQKKR